MLSKKYFYSSRPLRVKLLFLPFIVLAINVLLALICKDLFFNKLIFTCSKVICILSHYHIICFICKDIYSSSNLTNSMLQNELITLLELDEGSQIKSSTIVPPNSDILIFSPQHELLLEECIESYFNKQITDADLAYLKLGIIKQEPVEDYMTTFLMWIIPTIITSLYKFSDHSPSIKILFFALIFCIIEAIFASCCCSSNDHKLYHFYKNVNARIEFKYSMK